MSIIDTVREALVKAVHAGRVIKGEEGVNSYHYHIQEYDSEESAKANFEKQKEVFLNVDNWTALSEIENLAFTHYDKEGNRVRRKAKEGDFVMLDLPGPVPKFWVNVESIDNQPDQVTIIIRPSYDPTERPLKKEVTAHFFDRQTINILNFEREGKRLIAEVKGVSAAINNDAEEAGETAIINTTVALGGWAGLQKRQWESFTKNLVELSDI
jgi:hypothetical protein